MDIAAAITWVFANPQLALYGAGGGAIVVLLLSLWGLRRTIRNRGGGVRARAGHAGLARHEILSELSEPFEPEISAPVFAKEPAEPVVDEATPASEDDGEPFDEKMTRLTALLSEQMAEAAELDEQIRFALGGLGYGV